MIVGAGSVRYKTSVAEVTASEAQADLLSDSLSRFSSVLPPKPDPQDLVRLTGQPHAMPVARVLGGLDL